MSDITLINDSEQSSLVTNGLAKNGELYLKKAGSTNAGAIVVYDNGVWRTFANEASSGFSNTYSVDFDGANDYMDFGTNTSINSTSAFSVSAWFNVYNITTTYPTICILKTNLTKGFVISLDSQLTAYRGVWFGSASTEFKGFATGNSTLSTLISSGWHHLVLTYDGVDPLVSSSFAVYVDGVNYAVGSSPIALGTYANVNYVGKGAYQYEGLIDEFAIFNTELSASDITSIYNSGVPADLSSLSPVGWWRMGDNDGGTGTTITDQGSGGNDGTLTNGPTFSTDVPS